MIRRLLAKRRFDADWYVKTYPDVDREVKFGRWKDAFDHYWLYGRAEGRLPSKPRFDEEWYVSVNSDVREGIAKGEFGSGYEHFLLFGFKEGRTPVPDPRSGKG